MPFWIPPLSNEKLFRGGTLLRCCVSVTKGNSFCLRESYNTTGLRRWFHNRPLVDTEQNDRRGEGSLWGKYIDVIFLQLCRLLWVFKAHTSQADRCLTRRIAHERGARHRSSLANAAVSQGVLNRCVCAVPGLAARVNPFGVPGTAQGLLFSACLHLWPLYRGHLLILQCERGGCSSTFAFFSFAQAESFHWYSASWKTVLSAAPFFSVCSAVWQNTCNDRCRQKLDVCISAVATMGETVHG